MGRVDFDEKGLVQNQVFVPPNVLALDLYM